MAEKPAIVPQLAEFPEPGDYAHNPGIGWFRVDPEIGAARTLAWLRGDDVVAGENGREQDDVT